MKLTDIINGIDAQVIALRCAAELAELKNEGFCVILENIADKIEELSIFLEEIDEDGIDIRADACVARAFHEEVMEGVKNKTSWKEWCETDPSSPFLGRDLERDAQSKKQFQKILKNLTKSLEKFNKLDEMPL